MSPYDPRPEGLNTQPAPPSVVETIAEGSNRNPPPTYAKPAPPPAPPPLIGNAGLRVPEMLPPATESGEAGYVDGWNACIGEFLRLNRPSGKAKS
ncbi:hypothetical protein [Pandoraea commovens]|uniref:Uncharacterized protein n=1 Tax=Pandoraea commovens TaxID=2508289 RepID=A0A5E4SGR5_9BURK|nr:hypothetical protein [Pandoraea commovens]VVD75126.1 hypothetical protein PCO31010_00836 [Pandoraea commovens]